MKRLVLVVLVTCACSGKAAIQAASKPAVDAGVPDADLELTFAQKGLGDWLMISGDVLLPGENPDRATSQMPDEPFMAYALRACVHHNSLAKSGYIDDGSHHLAKIRLRKCMADATEQRLVEQGVERGGGRVDCWIGNPPNWDDLVVELPVDLCTAKVMQTVVGNGTAEYYRAVGIRTVTCNTATGAIELTLKAH